MIRIRFALQRDGHPWDYRLVSWPAVPRVGEAVYLHESPRYGCNTETWYVHEVIWTEEATLVAATLGASGHPTGSVLVEIGVRKTKP